MRQRVVGSGVGEGGGGGGYLVLRIASDGDDQMGTKIKTPNPSNKTL